MPSPSELLVLSLGMPELHQPTKEDARLSLSLGGATCRLGRSLKNVDLDLELPYW